MLNIEIYGTGFQGSVLTGKDMLKIHIDEIMQRVERDVIITIIEAIPISCDVKHKLMPFIRVCSTDIDEIGRVVQALKENKLGVNVETLLLSGFIPANEME